MPEPPRTQLREGSRRLNGLLRDALVDEVRAVDVELDANLAGSGRRRSHRGRGRNSEQSADHRDDCSDALHEVFSLP